MLITFYETPGFYVLIAVIGLLLLWGFLKLRVHHFKRSNLILEKKIPGRTKQMQSMLQELTLSREALEERNRVQQRLLTAISHDIKSPLMFQEMVARQFLENLRKGQDDMATSVKVAELLQEGSYRLLLLTDNLVQYLKLYANGESIHSKPVHIFSLVDDKRRIFAEIAASKGNYITNRIPDDLYVESDDTLLSVILHNLLDNALKVTTDGEVFIDGEEQQDHVIIRVSDTGAGMRQHLVEWCNDNSPTDSNIGITGGMGLLIVKELVHWIGGTLKVNSEQGKGTLIQLMLPVGPGEEKKEG